MTKNASAPLGNGLVLPDEETAARIALACAGVSGEPTVGIGIQAVGSAAALVSAVHDNADKAIPISAQMRKQIRARATGAAVARSIEAAVALGIHIVGPSSVFWPTQVEELGALSPLVLWVQGDRTTLTDQIVGLTGSTSPSEDGLYIAQELAIGFADRGCIIAAGPTRGVDETALRSATAMGGKTVMVIAQAPAERSLPDSASAVVAEVPSSRELSLRSQRRARTLLVALSSKIIVVESERSRTTQEAASLAKSIGKPVGVVLSQGSPQTRTAPDGTLYGCPVVTSMSDADLLR